MPPDSITALDQRIADLEQVLGAAKQLREVVAKHPELVSLLLGEQATTKPSKTPTNGTSHASAKPASASQRVVLGGRTAQENFEKIAKALGDDKALSVNDLMAATGLKRSATVQVVYRTHNALFDRLDSEGSQLLKLWRLKPDWRSILEGSK